MAANATLWTSQSGPMFELTAAADWVPVYAWETDDAGRRRPSERQQLDNQGTPVWEIRVIGRQDVYGRAEEAFLSLRMAAVSKPAREDLALMAVAA